MATKEYNIDKIIFASIDYRELHTETVEWFEKSCPPLYKDQVLKEDIYNLDDCLSDFEDNPPSKIVKEEIEELLSQISVYETEYLRITY